MTDDVSTDRTTHLSRWLAMCAAALFAVTWRLWTPQHVFPQVPLSSVLVTTPSWADWCGVIAWGITLLVVLWRPLPHRLGRIGLAGFVVAMLGMIAIDQHRLQPWAWQMVLTALLLIGLPRRRALWWCGLLTASIYFHSAISKFDHSFPHSHAMTFLGVFADGAGVPVRQWPQWLQLATAWLFPAGELLVAVALVMWPTRRIGLWLSWLMHGTLLIVLGPWGLNHEWGVLLWNVYFIGQNAILFPQRDEIIAENTSTERQPSAVGYAVIFVALAAMILPFFATRGWFDEWPSWAVYTARAEQVRIEIRSDAAEQLPADCLPFLEDAAETETLGFSWRRLDVGSWSLETLHAPTYPQARFQLAVANAVAERSGIDTGIRVTIHSPADRWTGQRWSETLSGRDALKRLLQAYRINTQARPPW